MKFMLLVDYESEKPTIQEAFGANPKMMSAFMDKVFDRWVKPVENDKVTDIFFDALNEMPEENRASIIMSMAVVQMAHQVKLVATMGGIIKKPGEKQ